MRTYDLVNTDRFACRLRQALSDHDNRLGLFWRASAVYFVLLLQCSFSFQISDTLDGRLTIYLVVLFLVRLPVALLLRVVRLLIVDEAIALQPVAALTSLNWRLGSRLRLSRHSYCSGLGCAILFVFRVLFVQLVEQIHHL